MTAALVQRSSQVALTAASILGAVYILFVHGNVTSIYWLLMVRNAATPSSTRLLRLVEEQLEQHVLCSSNKNSSDWTLVDLGCGTGQALLSLRHLFVRSIGIEIEEDIAVQAKQATSKYEDVEIVRGDMQTTPFVDRPTVFFIYEPLWQIKDAKRVEKIYRNVLARMAQTTSPFFLIYISGLNSHQISVEMMSQLGTIVFQKRVGSLLQYRTVYLVQGGGGRGDATTTTSPTTSQQ